MKKPEVDLFFDKLGAKQISSEVKLPISKKKLSGIPRFRQSEVLSPNEKRNLNKSLPGSKPKVSEIQTSIPTGKESKYDYDRQVIDEIYGGPLVNTTDQTKILSYEKMLQDYIHVFPNILMIVRIACEFSHNDAQTCQNLLLASTGQQNSAKDSFRVKFLNAIYIKSDIVRFVMDKVIIKMIREIDYKNFCLIMGRIEQYGLGLTEDKSLLHTTPTLEIKSKKSSLKRLQGSQTFPPNPVKPEPYHSNMHLITNVNHRKTTRLKRSLSLPDLRSNSSPGSRHIPLSRDLSL